MAEKVSVDSRDPVASHFRIETGVEFVGRPGTARAAIARVAPRCLDRYGI